MRRRRAAAAQNISTERAMRRRRAAVALVLACLVGGAHSLPAPSGVRFLHVSDLHLDPEYLVNGTTYSQCHRAASSPRKGLARKFGMVGTDCDAPLELIGGALRQIREGWGRNAEDGNKVKVVLWTGDSARHDRDPAVPMTTEAIVRHNQLAIDFMRDTFDPDVAVVPNIGNHDVHPANHMLPPPPIPSPFSPHAPQSRPHFLHELLRVWSPILFSPPAWEHGDITTDFLNFGSFVKTVIPGENGLRVVSLNTLWYFPSNDGAGSCKFARNWGRETALLNLETSTGTSVWDLQRDPESGDWYVSLPASIQTQRRKKKLDIGSASLLWLHNVLLASRQAHHGIMIIGHIPPQGNYGPLWEDRCTDWFTRMVGEFMKDVVVGVWSGHTNEDNVAFVVRDGSKARRGAQTEPMDEMDNEREDETEDSSQVDEKRNEDEVEDSSEVDEKRKERFRDLDPTLSSRWRPLSLSPAAAPILLQPNTELAGAFFTSPSLVPARNPGFRIGELVWDQTWRLNGWTQYALDLKLANKLDRLEFGVEYETGVEYGIGGVGRTRGMVRQGVGFSPKAEQGITPEEWKVFIGRYSKNAKVRELYERFKDVEGELR